MKSNIVNRKFVETEVGMLSWIRLYFERVPGFPPIDEAEEFKEYLGRNFADCDLAYAGYGLMYGVPKHFSGGAPNWMAILWNPSPDVFEHLITKIDNERRHIDGYMIHACAKLSNHGCEYVIALEDDEVTE